MAPFTNFPSVKRIAVVAVSMLALSLATLTPSFAALAAPTITSPTNGAVTQASVLIKGTGTPGTTIEVTDALPTPTSLGTTTVASNTGWALQVTLADGTHSIRATATDGTETSPASAATVFEVDAIRPGVTITSPANEHTFGPGEAPLITGTASDDRALGAIRLEYWTLGQLDRAVLADCDCAGQTSATWSHEPNLGPGDWLVKAWSADEGSGNYSVAATRRFTVTLSGLPGGGTNLELLDEILPPDILNPGDGSLQPGAAQPIVIGGTTEAGSTVEVYEEVDGIGPVGTAADADNDGRWQLRLRLPTGEYGIRAIATDAEGNVSAPSELIEFTVDGQRPLVDILTPDKAVFLPLQQVVLEGVVSDNFEVASVVVEYYDIHGKSILREFADCACPADEATWRHEPSLPFGPGHYTAKVWAFDVAGNGAHKDTITFIRSL